MIRVAAAVLALLVSLHVAAGEAWLCLCQMPVADGCCCKKAHAADDSNHETSTVEKRCCCSVEQGSGHQAPQPPVSEAAQGSPDHTSLTAEVSPYAPPQFRPLVTAAHTVERNTGPPWQALALGTVRLRP